MSNGCVIDVGNVQDSDSRDQYETRYLGRKSSKRLAEAGASPPTERRPIKAHSPPSRGKTETASLCLNVTSWLPYRQLIGAAHSGPDQLSSHSPKQVLEPLTRSRLSPTNIMRNYQQTVPLDQFAHHEAVTRSHHMANMTIYV